VTKRLYFIKQLKRAGVPHTQLLHFYLAVIRPVLVYGAPVWHHSLNKSQKNQTEAIQKRAIRIVYSCACDMPYTSGLHLAGVGTWINVGVYCHTSSSNQFCNQHPVCIIYFRHLAILNYFLASGLPQNIPESPIEQKIPVVHLLCLSPLPVVLVCFLVYNVHVYC